MKDRAIRLFLVEDDKVNQMTPKKYPEVGYKAYEY